MENAHHYRIHLQWRGRHTRTYDSYSREHMVRMEGKPDMICSADPQFLGDDKLHNPEDLLMAALSGCHLLTYLALCARARIDVVTYEDHAEGTLQLTAEGGGHFTEVILRPRVTLANAADLEKARRFHGDAHKYCFIARSVNFPVRCEPEVIVAP